MLSNQTVIAGENQRSEKASAGAANDGGLTVVVPLFNECENVEAVVTEIHEVFAESQLHPVILVVDDGSVDGAAERLRALTTRYPKQVKIARHDKNLGLGVALRTGLDRATTTWVGWLPADGQFAAADLLRLYYKREGMHVVTGAVDLSHRRRADNIFRAVLSTGLRVVMRIFHPTIPSFNGILVIRRDSVDVSRLVCRTGLVNMEILDRIRLRHGRQFIENDRVTVRARRSGSSKVANMRTLLIVVADLIKLRIDYLRRDPS